MSVDLRLGPSMWAVRNIEEAGRFYAETLGANVGEPHVVEHGNFLRSFVEFGGGSLQLMQPLDGEKVLTRFLDKVGEGFYGQVYLTDDLGAARRHMESKGIRIIAEEIDLGDMKETVLHPSSTRGVLTVLRELVP